VNRGSVEADEASRLEGYVRARGTGLRDRFGSVSRGGSMS